MQLATLGWEDSLLLMVLALVVFGPRRLPMIGKQIGKLMYEFRKASNDFKFQMEEEMRAAEDADRRKKEEAEQERVAALAAQSQASVSAPAQTVESTADVGAVEPPTPPGYPEPYPAEGASAGAETVGAGPVIQPPTTGEQVSAGRPDYYFEAQERAAAEAAEVTDVNPDADVAANAEGVSAASAAAAEHQPAAGAVNPEGPSATPNHPSDQDLSPGAPANHPSDQDLSPGAPAKETVSQHG